MKNINWKLRLQNRTTLLAIIGVVVTAVYQLLGILGVVTPISEDEVTKFIGLILNILVALGVLVDPTTKGVSDSKRALTYTEPKDDTEAK